MKVLLFLCLFSSIIYAFTPIEGGVAVPNDEKYKSFIRIVTPDGYSCSATKVSPRVLITAAHCIIDEDFENLYKHGDKILDYGRVSRIDIHPLYKESQKEVKIESLKMQKLSKQAASMTSSEIKKLISSAEFLDLKNRLNSLYSIKSQSDIAFITLDKSFNNKNYPDIISPSHNFKKRGKIEIVGFGTTQKSWNKKDQKYITNSVNKAGSLATTCWDRDPKSYKDAHTKLSNDINGVLNFKSTVKHVIRENIDYQKRSQNMVMPGDSGASAVEYDQDNKQVITAIASTGEDFADNNNNMKLEIAIPNKENIKITLKKGINNWGDPTIDDLKFPRIVSELSKRGLLKDGVIKDGVVISRSYTRKSTATFADLLHPENQSFINSVMERK